ncbi:C39 family peptidase [Apilactobacillus apisilvae]|uniref:C39 family peptidase n=1 Tax=Apilactobacillus apisilvae TaxID=2923364 RepID=A0ABY4PG53_9LACO|nr:C39 family peptidase [Apilactobacillus apisilvae]UQS84653.1 C39 family peptidase [Apilactobacillus apisilvae]
MLNYKKIILFIGFLALAIFGASYTTFGSMNDEDPISGTYSIRPAEKNANAVELNAPYISQKAIKAWDGCEAASLLEAFHSKGVLLNTDLKEFLKQMPISKDGNPNNGFAGSPYSSSGKYFESIFPKALDKWGNQYHKVKDMTGSSINDLKKQIDAGNPVLTYIVSGYQKPQYKKYSFGTEIDNSHVVLLDGYERGYYHVSDPNHGQYWVKASSFEQSYNYKKYAVAVQ